MSRGQRLVHLPFAAVSAGRPVKTVLSILQVEYREACRGIRVIARRKPNTDRARRMCIAGRHLHDLEGADHGARLGRLAGPTLDGGRDQLGGRINDHRAIASLAAIGRFFDRVPSATGELVFESLPGLDHQVARVGAVGGPRELNAIGLPVSNAGQRAGQEDGSIRRRVCWHVDNDRELLCAERDRGEKSVYHEDCHASQAREGGIDHQ